MIRLRRTCVILALMIVSMAGMVSAADNLSGAWTMIKYEGPASHGAATGLLLFGNGHFSLVYTMDENGQRWGRSHAGTYDVKGDTVTYHVAWSMQYVSGQPSVAAKRSDRQAKFAVTGDTLTITFSNGSVQTFKRSN